MLEYASLIIATVLLLLLSIVIAILLRQKKNDFPSLIQDEFRKERKDASENSMAQRREISETIGKANDLLITAIAKLGETQQGGLNAVETRVNNLLESNEKRLKDMRATIDSQLKSLQDTNEKKLEQLREPVDETLQSTLEKRLGESFNLVSERREAVQRGLGDMQTLATGVGDLKRMLTNVKTRGTWGEYQLGDILEQILTPEQFSRNVKPKRNSGEIVEYAINLPEGVWLPIDSKFPLEDYERLLDASERGDAQGVEKAKSALVKAVRLSAKDINDKYIDPPQTTDFAILFLPTEGLYAEVIRQPGLMTQLQQDFRVTVAGPTTLGALLNSFRMGFRTLAIEQRSSEVWTILSGVKTEFGKFGHVLDKVKRQLDTASNTIEETGVRTRAMDRALREVEEAPKDLARESFQFSQIVSSDEER